MQIKTGPLLHSTGPWFAKDFDPELSGEHQALAHAA